MLPQTPSVTPNCAISGDIKRPFVFGDDELTNVPLMLVMPMGRWCNNYQPSAGQPHKNPRQYARESNSRWRDRINTLNTRQCIA